MPLHLALKEPPKYRAGDAAGRVILANYTPSTLERFLRVFDNFKYGDIWAPGSTDAIMASHMQCQFDATQVPEGRAAITVYGFGPFELRNGGSALWDERQHEVADWISPTISALRIEHFRRKRHWPPVRYAARNFQTFANVSTRRCQRCRGISASDRGAPADKGACQTESAWHRAALPDRNGDQRVERKRSRPRHCDQGLRGSPNRFRSVDHTMRFFTPEGGELIEIMNVAPERNRVVIQGKIMGAMPMKAVLTRSNYVKVSNF